MPPQKNIRAMAAVRAAAKDQPEHVPELPEPLASDPRVGIQRGRAIAAMYSENIALQSAAIAFGDGTKSLHTRVLCMQILRNMIEEVPETVPAPPENAHDRVIE